MIKLSRAYKRIYALILKAPSSISLSLLISIILLSSFWFVAAWTHGKYYAASFAFTLSAIFITSSYVLGRFPSIRVRILALLGIYMGLILLFSAIHYAAFLYKPDFYAFSENIAEGKRLENFKNTYKEAFNRSRFLYILALLHSKPDIALKARLQEPEFFGPLESQLNAEKGLISLDSENSIRFLSITIATGRASSTSYNFEVRSNDFRHKVGGDLVSAALLPSTRAVIKMRASKSTTEMRKAIEALTEALINERDALLKEVRGYIIDRPDWNLFDFIYYSAVTLTTLGYGDILPNSTTARLIVLFNSVFGVFFIGFALILLWPKGDEANVS